MKLFLSVLCCLFSVSAWAQPILRNYFTTNATPIVYETNTEGYVQIVNGYSTNQTSTNAMAYGVNKPAIVLHGGFQSTNDTTGSFTTVSNASLLTTNASVGGGTITYSNAGGIAVFNAPFGQSSQFQFTTGNTPVMVISNGFVGVGKANPTIGFSIDTLQPCLINGIIVGRTANQWIFNSSFTKGYFGALSDNHLVVAYSDLTVSNGVFITCPTNGVAPPPFVYQPLGCFGSMCQSNVTNTVTTTGAGTYVVLTNYQTIRTNQFNASPANTLGSGYLTNVLAGYYRITIFATVLPGNNDTVEIELSVSGNGREEISALHTFDAAARADDISATGIIYLPANSYCALTINNRSSTSTIAVWRAGLTIGTP